MLRLALVVSACLLQVGSYPNTMESMRPEYGYPVGLLSDCPGVDKPAVLKPETIRKLSIIHQLDGSTTKAKKIIYTYHQMKELASHLDFSKKTMFYVGGYLDSPFYFASVGSMFASLYNLKGYNFIMVDNNPFTTTHYPIAARRMRQVAFHTAEMLVNLTKFGLDPKKLELLSISLGAHTMGFIAKNYYKLTGVKIGRLTGMDPAGPCFRFAGPADRLDSSDADFVDVMHTNIDGLGMAAPIGHVNFYVNGGEYQPGETDLWLGCWNLCSHARAGTLWWSALKRPNCFEAVMCDSVQQARDRDCYKREPRVINYLGLDVDQTKPGIYHLSTSNNPPYCLGDKGLKKKNDFYTKTMTMINNMSLLTV